MLSSTSVLIVKFFLGDRFPGVREMTSRFLFLDGTASSISANCGNSSACTEAGLSWAILVRRVRVERLVAAVAFINRDVSCEIFEVRIVKA